MILINLFAGPGAGKSTTMHGVMYRLKLAGVICEQAPEFAKDLVWEGRQGALSNQLYVTGKQLQRVERLNGEVDVVITDSPFILGCFYKPDWYHPGYEDMIVHMLKTRFHCMNYFITRRKKYVQKGRNQDEAGAKRIDVVTREFLTKHDIPFRDVDGDDDGSEALSVQEIVPEVLTALREGPPEWCGWDDPPNAKTRWPNVG